MSSKSGATRVGSRRAARQASADLGPMPVWNLGDLYPGPKSQAVQATSTRRPPRRSASRSAIRASSPGSAGDGAALAEAIAAYESLSDTDRQARLLRRPALRRRHVRSRERQVLRRHPGEDHRHHHRSDLLRAGAQQDRRGGARRGAAGAGARPLQALDRRPAQGEALSARGAARAAVPREGDHLAQRLEPALQRDHDGAALRGRGRDGAARARADAQLPDVARRGASGRPPPRRWPRCSRTTSASSR